MHDNRMGHITHVPAHYSGLPFFASLISACPSTSPISISINQSIMASYVKVGHTFSLHLNQQGYVEKQTQHTWWLVWVGLGPVGPTTSSLSTSPIAHTCTQAREPRACCFSFHFHLLFSLLLFADVHEPSGSRDGCHGRVGPTWEILSHFGGP